MLNNPFQIAVVVLQIAAAVWYWSYGRFLVGLLVFLYAVTNYIILLMGGKI